MIRHPGTYRVTASVADEASIAVSGHRLEIDTRNTVGAANNHRSVHHISHPRESIAQWGTLFVAQKQWGHKE